VGVRIEVLEEGVGGEEFILVDTVRIGVSIALCLCFP